MPKTIRHRTARKHANPRVKRRMDAALTELKQGELIRQLDEVELAYLFKHALVQDTAESTLLRGEHKRLHRMVAETIERLYANRLDEVAAALAQHYEYAEDDSKTLEYATRAGDRAFRGYALPEAVGFYDQALSAALRLPATPSSTLIHIYRQRGHVWHSNSEEPKAWENYLELERLALQRQERALELASLVERCILRSTFNVLFDPADARILAERAMPLARELDDRGAQSQVLWNLMRVTLTAEGDAERAIQYGEQALALARELGLNEQSVYVLGDLQYAYRAAGRVEDALHALEQARAGWRALNHQHMLADNLNQSAWILTALGKFEAAMQLTGEAKELSLQTSNSPQATLSLMIPARIAYLRGEIGAAFNSLAPVLQLANPILKGLFWMSLSWLYRDLGALEQAAVLAQKALEQVGDVPLVRVYSNTLYGTVIDILLELGNTAGAERAFSQLRPEKQTIELGAIFGGGKPASFPYTRMHLARGDFEDALKEIDPLSTSLQAFGILSHLPEALFLQARAWMGLEDREHAAEALARAQAVAEQIGARTILWQILAARSQVEAARGNVESTAQFRAQARQVVEYIAAHTPEASPFDPDLNLRETFLNLPEVRAVMEHPSAK